MVYQIDIRSKSNIPATYCETLTERFDNDDWLADALVENMESVRLLRNCIWEDLTVPLNDFEIRLIASHAIAFIKGVEKYMEPES